MKITLSGDTMMLLALDPVIDPVVNARAIQLARRLRDRLGAAVRDIVPSYCTIGIHFDPLLTDLAALERAVQEEARHAPDEVEATAAPPHRISVRYGGADGPDLATVAEFAGCSPAEVIERHATRIYRVYMIGFVPGFCYMGRVDSTIAAPRRRVPRERVPTGSVGIAGEQTGVYPISTPGGWQLIGRTDAVMFDPDRTPPSLLQPGDLVQFVPV
jgi:KipI family sensor histidine kinase inhibitor